MVGPFHLSLGLGLKAVQVGLVMAIGPVISTFSGVPSGRLVDAFGGERVLALGLSLLTAGALLLAILHELIGGASGMGMLFAFWVGTCEFASASPSAIASAMRLTFLLASGLVLVALVIAVAGRKLWSRSW